MRAHITVVRIAVDEVAGETLKRDRANDSGDARLEAAPSSIA